MRGEGLNVRTLVCKLFMAESQLLPEFPSLNNQQVGDLAFENIVSEHIWDPILL